MSNKQRLFAIATGCTFAAALGITSFFAFPSDEDVADAASPSEEVETDAASVSDHFATDTLSGPASDEAGQQAALEEAAVLMGMGVEEFQDYQHGLVTLDLVEDYSKDRRGYHEMRLDHKQKIVEVLWLSDESVPDGITDLGRDGYRIDVRRVVISEEVQEWIRGENHSPTRGRVSGVGYDVEKGGFVVRVMPGDTEFETPASEMREVLDLPAEVVEVTKNLNGGGPLSRRSEGGEA